MQVSAAQMSYVHITGETTFVFCDFRENFISGHSTFVCVLSNEAILDDFRV